MNRFALHRDARDAAERPWTPRKKGRGDAARLRIFDDAVAERLSASPPWLPALALGPLALVAIAASLGDPGALALGLAVGGLAWSLFEYLLHRFLLHWPTGSPGNRIAALLLHGHHHVAPNDRDRLVALPFQWFGATALFAGVSWWATGTGSLWFALCAGWIIGYLAYEWVHWSAHHRAPRSRLGRALRAHHLRHHFVDHEANFGISSPLWDLVFGSRLEPDERPAKVDRGDA